MHKDSRCNTELGFHPHFKMRYTQAMIIILINCNTRYGNLHQSNFLDLLLSASLSPHPRSLPSPLEVVLLSLVVGPLVDPFMDPPFFTIPFVSLEGNLLLMSPIRVSV